VLQGIRLLHNCLQNLKTELSTSQSNTAGTVTVSAFTALNNHPIPPFQQTQLGEQHIHIGKGGKLLSSEFQYIVRFKMPCFSTLNLADLSGNFFTSEHKHRDVYELVWESNGKRVCYILMMHAVVLPNMCQDFVALGVPAHRAQLPQQPGPRSEKMRPIQKKCSFFSFF